MEYKHLKNKSNLKDVKILKPSNCMPEKYLEINMNI